MNRVNTFIEVFCRHPRAEEREECRGEDSRRVAFRPVTCEKKGSFRLNSQFPPFALRSVDIQWLTSHLSPMHNDLPYAQFISGIFYDEGATTRLGLKKVMRTILSHTPGYRVILHVLNGTAFGQDWCIWPSEFEEVVGSWSRT